MEKILAQGAEAVIILSENFIIKDRVKKSYRLPELDNKIRKQRTKSETKLLEKASKIINTPTPSFEPTKESYRIKIPYIKGEKLSDHLNKFSLEKQNVVMNEVGNSIAKLHSHDIIHGDLTTSNMILVEDSGNNLKEISKIEIDIKKTLKLKSSQRSALTKSGAEQSQSANEMSSNFSVCFIDFGLGFISKKIEDKAVDLHLLKEALEAKHFQHWQELWKEVEKSYEKQYPQECEKVFERLHVVEKRGRYKDKY